MRGSAVLGMLAVLAVLPAAGGAGARAAGASPRAGPLVLNLKFQRTARGPVAAVLGSKQYMLALEGTAWTLETDPYDARYRVYDDASGKSWTIDTRPCRGAAPPRAPYAGMFGAPWVLFTCSSGASTWALYNVIDRRWRFIDGGQAFRDAVHFEVGARWIELTYYGNHDCGDHIHYGCGPPPHHFYNIRSRRLRSSLPMSRSSVVDLDSSQLVRHLCAPLQTPPPDPQGKTGPLGTLALLGRFALEFTPYDVGFPNNTAPEYTAPRGARGEWSLRRCGSNLRLSVDAQQGQTVGALTATDDAVLWSMVNSQGTWNGHVAGRFLPSLRQFVASVPQGVAGSRDGAVLDSSRIYVLTRNRTLWRASFPTDS